MEQYRRTAIKIAEEQKKEIDSLKSEIARLTEDRDLWKLSERQCNEYTKELLDEIGRLKTEIGRKDAALSNLLVAADIADARGELYASFDGKLLDAARKVLNKTEEDGE